MTTTLVALGDVDAYVLISVQSIQRLHLLFRELEIENVEIGDYTFFRVGFGQWDESRVRQSHITLTFRNARCRKWSGETVWRQR